MTEKNKKAEVILLLRDYMNFLPSGQQEAYVPVGQAFSATDSWPLTAESERRMEKGSMTGETYDKLDKALRLLSIQYPTAYHALLEIYLREDSGHRDLDHIKKAARGGSLEALKLEQQHDIGIEKLAAYLADTDLYVRWPHKATGPKPGQDIETMHEELFATFLRYYDKDFHEEASGELPYRQALNAAVMKMNNYYSPRHADRIIKGRLNATA